MRVVGRLGWSLVLLLAIPSCFARGEVAQSVTTRLPLVFEPNQGQVPGNVRYLLREGVLEGEFRQDGVRLTLLSDKKTNSHVSMRLVGAREDAAITGDGMLEGRTNYLIGSDPAHWLRQVPNYSQVRYHQVYPGTDLVFYGNGGALEHDFELRPGGDPSNIAFKLDDAQSVTLEDDGNLRVGLADGAITFNRPVAYQMVAGRRRDVDAAFTVGGDGTIRFRLGTYDQTEKLVIDPALSFSTYLSSLAEQANLIATDASGNSYVSGIATLGFPVTSGAFAGCTNCTTNSAVTFISKLSADGSTLIYSTVIGGNSFAQPTGIAVDKNGNALVSGWTGASDFPTKNGQSIAPQNNNYVGYLVSLSPDGSSLNYGTLLGSSPTSSQSAMTYATALAVDSAGNAYVTGETGNGFFTTNGALNQGGGGGSGDDSIIYVAKFSPTGGLIYSAVLGTADPQTGGAGPIGASAIAVDAAGDAFVVGQAGTLWPISSNAYLKEISGSMPYAAPFVTEVAPDAKSLVYSTYLDYAYDVTAVAVLSNGSVFVTGGDAGASYPTTPNAYQQNSGGGGPFLTELNSTGSALVYSTIIPLGVSGMALDADGNIWLAGETSGPQFPLVVPIQGVFPTTNGLSEPASVLSQFDPTGETLKFSTFLGGSAPGFASSVAIDGNQKVHVAGAAGPGMYTTPGVYAGSVPTPGTELSGSIFAYVALIDPAISSGALCLGGSAAAGLSFGYLVPQTTASQSIQVTNCGSASLVFASIGSSNAAFTVPSTSNGCTGSLAVGTSCTVSVQFVPAAVQAYTGQLTFTSNASITTTSIPLSGSGGAPVAAFGPPGETQTLNFPPTLVGQTSAAEFIVLYNNGTVPLTVSQISATSGFGLAPGGNCSNSLAAHQYCFIDVDFAPSSAGTINGTLSVSSNDPVNPTISASLTGTAFASYPIATITALLNPSYPINSGTTPITMSVSGTDFFPTSVVYINGIAQTTTYNGGTSLSVTFNSSLLNAVGQFPVTVVNPTPGGGSSAPYPLTGYLSIPLTATALTVDPVGGLLYAAIPASAAQNPNTVIPINPATGALMTPIAVSSGPRALAASSDGTELYVASTGVLQRFNLKTLALEKTFNLPVDPEWGQTYVQEMHVVPGSPQSIVVELFADVDPAEDGAALYNDSGLVNWLPGEAPTSEPLQIDSFTFTSSSSIYALPEAFNSTFFTEVRVKPTGLSYTGGTAGEVSQETGDVVRSDGTLLYTNSGQVWNPSTQMLLGTYVEPNESDLFYATSVVPDTSNGHTYFLDTYSGYSDYQAVDIDVFDQASYALMGTVPFTSIYPPDVTDLVRWGGDGFAFRCVDITGEEPSANQIVIVTSNLVPSTALITSPTPSTLLAGPNTTFTWTAPPGASYYELYVGGTGVGSNNLYSSGKQTVTSLSVAGLPTNGETVYVRLMTNFSGTWKYLDYTYTAANKGTLTSPAAGSTLGGPNVTFSWTPATGTEVSGYRLYLGSTGVGSNNLYSSALQTGTSFAASALPTNGETIYARLITSFNGTLASADYTYTADTHAELTSPTPGGLLPGRTVTFTWSAAVGATGYELWLGRTGVGSNNLYDSLNQRVTSITVPDLPENGETIYARLLTGFGGSWTSVDYTFTSVTQSAMATPTPGSTLTGPSITFTWTAGVGATAYELYLGSTGAGSNNLYSSGSKTVTSLTVNALPANGETIYARLLTDFNGSWGYTDYTYTADTHALITSPTSGTLLPGPNTTFTWSAATGATDYELYLGSTGVGSSNLYSSGSLTGTSFTAANLPTNGETIYARVLTNFGGTWSSADSTYTAATHAVLASPAPGSTLTGTSATFTLTPATGTEETAYELYLGSTGIGSNNLYSSGQTAATSFNVKSLPSDGETIYVRVLTNFNGVWGYVDYTLTAP
jgi:hypothetical protein